MTHVLVVDDDPITREILTDNLRHAGFQTMGAEDGERAWRLLRDNPELFSAILLDRILPDMDGLDVLRKVKATSGLAHIPIIMQTAKSDQADILDGLKNGAYYYLTKPVQPDTLLAIVGTAVSDYRNYRAMRQKVRQAARTFGLMTEAEFAFRVPAEARDIAALLANTCADPEKVVLGLTELMLNAIEHGNLGIGYEEKTQLIREDQLQAEINRRLRLPEYQGRAAKVHFRREGPERRFTIRDQGNGFNWLEYLEMSPARAFDNHGRGIAMARLLSFDRLEFNESGTEVAALVRD